MKSIRCLITVAVCFFAFGCWGGASRPSVNSVAAGRYGHQLHDQFYEAWVQPPAVALPRGKVSVPVDVTIAGDGRVQDFRIAKGSGNDRIDKSIAAVGTKIKQVAPPPDTASGKTFKLRIYFELDVKR